MPANFKKGMGLSEISADQFNRMQNQLTRPRPGGTLDRRNNRYEPAPNIVVGVNSTGVTLVNGSIAVLGDIVDGGSISRAAVPDMTLPDRNNVVYNFIVPSYPQPEPDDEGNVSWPYPEQRMVVIQTTVPVQPGDRCFAILFGKAIVTVKLNDYDYEAGIPYKYATFIDGNTEMLQSADVGPAEILGYRGGYAAEQTRECTIYFPFGSTVVDESEDPGTDPGPGGTTITLGRVISRNAETGLDTIQPVFFNDSGSIEDVGDPVTAYFLRNEP